MEEKIYIKKIKDLLKEKGLTQKDLAVKLGKNENTVVNYLKQRTKIDVDTLVEIAEILQVPVSLLFEEDNTFVGNKNIQALTYELDKLKQELNACKQLLSEKERIIAEKEKQIRLQEEMIQMLREKK